MYNYKVSAVTSGETLETHATPVALGVLGCERIVCQKSAGNTRFFSVFFASFFTTSEAEELGPAVPWAVV